MRHLHLHIDRELRKESVILSWQWEHLLKNMVGYGNHRIFSLTCLSASITPDSIRLKNTVRTSRGFDIIGRSEKQLLDERLRNINNTIKISN